MSGRLVRLLAVLCVLALMVGGAASGQVDRGAGEASGEDFLVLVVHDPEYVPSLRVLDSTGRAVWNWPADDDLDGFPVVVAGASGVFFFAFAPTPTSGTSSTSIFAVSIADSEPHPIGGIDGSAYPLAVMADGTHLLLRKHADDGARVLVELPIPSEWQGVPVSASRDQQLAWVRTPEDGYRSLGLVQESSTLHRVVVTDVSPGERPVATDLGYELRTAYWSLLLAPDGETAYAVDFWNQRVEAIDVDRRAVIGSIETGRAPTKARTWEAALSPAGDRLYVVGRSGNAPDGIDVFAAGVTERLANWLPRHGVNGLAVSPGGQRLYAFGRDEIVVLDTANGAEIATLHLPDGEWWPEPLLVASAG